MTRKRPHLIKQDPARPPLAILPLDPQVVKKQRVQKHAALTKKKLKGKV